MTSKSELETEFLKAIADGKAELDRAILDVETALEKAITIAENHGLPFRINPFFDGDYDLDRTFIPASFMQKFKDLDPYFVDDHTNVCPDGERDIGWEYWSTSSLHC